jgi:hypothetical protein
MFQRHTAAYDGAQRLPKIIDHRACHRVHKIGNLNSGGKCEYQLVTWPRYSDCIKAYTHIK